MRVEAQHERLRVEMADAELRFFSVKDAELATRFMELVREELRMFNEAGLAYL